jgi:hypothetical protein
MYNGLLARVPCGPPEALKLLRFATSDEVKANRVQQWNLPVTGSDPTKTKPSSGRWTALLGDMSGRGNVRFDINSRTFAKRM